MQLNAATLSSANANTTEIIFWIVAICGLIFGCCIFIALLIMRHKERAIERKTEAILNGEIGSYRDYLLYRINQGEKKEDFVFSYRDYLLRELNRNNTN